MNTSARIDELRKKFEENPRRYFAPLANEYRKAGDLGQAIALCREHLPKQPGHMSGYIVFGQALYEAGELGEARQVFEQALALDPENLIALRHLGDIAHANGDAPGARRWYERVLDADPRNNDIAAQLASLATGLTPVSSPAVASSVSPFARPMETPPLPMSPIGQGMTPTPDSVMRAVDMDAINARVIHRTPIDLDAFESTPHPSTPAESQQTPQASASVDLDDTDPFGFPVNVDTTSMSSAHAPLSNQPEDTMHTVDLGHSETDATANYGSANDDPVQAAAVEHQDAEAGSEELADAAFEEGLIAPEWSDTAELLSRVATPRSFTPRSETPVVGEAIADTAAAFGREADDAPEPAALVDAADDVADVFPRTPTPASTPTVAPVSGIEPTEHEPLDLAAMDIASMDLSTFTNPPADDASFAEDVHAVDGAVRSEVSEPDHDFEPTVSSLLTPAAPMTPIYVPAVEGLSDSAPSSSADEPSFELEVPEELPWLAVSEADVSADVAMHADEHREPGLQEIAEAIAEDARAAGDERAITVSAVDEPTWSEHAASESAAYEEQSFADEASADESGAEIEAGIAEDFGTDEPFEIEAPIELSVPPTGSTAFVTETMAELLVSQGFYARAADVYEELVRRNPSDEVLTSRLAEVRGMLAPVSEVADSVADSVSESFSVEAATAETGADDEVDMRSMPTPAYGTPAFGTPMYTAAFPSLPTPDFSSAVASDAAISDDVFGSSAPRTTPYAQPAVSDEELLAPARTAREWFAAIAARRVPRRTPSQSSPSIMETPAEGLAALFGTDASAQDDAAARALADAFAPVTSEDLAAGVALDFEFARSTPAFSPVVASSMTPASTPSLPPNVNLGQVGSPDDRLGSGGNAGFSFDKFFPDPATRRATPAAGSGDTPSAPVTDDLAQFSAWLKGLGNT